VRNERLASLGTARDHLEGVETNGLRQRAALTNDNLITFVATEARGDVGRDVGVTLFITLVLANEVQVIHAHDDGAVHLGGLDDAGQNAATNGHVTRERALLVNVRACVCLKSSHRQYTFRLNNRAPVV
jgi:hypothetical protein